MGDEELIAVSEDKQLFQNFKATVYQMTARPDSTTKIFQHEVAISLDDIFDLNDRVSEKLEQYEDAGFIVNVTVNFTNKKIKQFASWKEFSNHKWYESECINSIVVSWDFYAILPRYKLPQKHSLMVKMSNSLKPEEMLNLIFSGNIEDMEELDGNFFPIVARADFVDSGIGDELLNIVIEWAKGLRQPIMSQNKPIRKLKRYKGVFCTLLNYVTYFFILMSSIILYMNFINHLSFKLLSEITKDVFMQISAMTFFICIIWIFSKKLVNTLTDRIYDKLRNYGECHLFDITKGDKNKQNELQELEKKNKISIIKSIIYDISINIICAILSNVVF